MITLEQHLAEHALEERVWGWRCGCLFYSYGESLAWDQVAELQAKHVADAWREARTVTTVEQLDALPVGSVVQEESVQHTWIRHGWLWHCSCDGCDIEWSTTGLFDEQQREPLLILWTPEDGAA